MAEYIERDEAIRKAQDACIKIVFRVLGRGITQFDAADIVEEMESVPVADVVGAKHGEWKILEAEIGLYSCSLCEHKILREKCNFCPNCGAKMDGKDETE